MHTFTTGGAALAYDVDGTDGPLVVQLHGLTSSRERDRQLGLDLSRALRSHRILRYDARGHGGSTGTPEPQTYRWDRLAADLLASRAGSIVLLPKPPAARGRVLPVADGRSGRSATAYGPDENNVHNGDYPLQVPLILYVRPDKVAGLRPALRWLCSDAAAELLTNQGLTPAPAAARAAFLQRLDTR